MIKLFFPKGTDADFSARSRNRKLKGKTVREKSNGNSLENGKPPDV